MHCRPTHRAGEAARRESIAGSGPTRPAASQRSTKDDVYWAAIITLVTAVLLVNGRYGLIQDVSTFLVVGFTAGDGDQSAGVCRPSRAGRSAGAIMKRWLSFRLPPAVEGLARSPLATALATFGIIGVGTNELIPYPYWCLEKGYARFTGPRDDTPDWAERAQGWMRVMRWDACVSMVIYTFATVAFYLLGAAVLHREGLDPGGNQMIRSLGQMYVPVFGAWAKWLFLFGAFAVLYSTFFVANAGHARVAADAVRVFRVGARTERAQLGWIRASAFGFPVSNLLIYVFIPRAGRVDPGQRRDAGDHAADARRGDPLLPLPPLRPQDRPGPALGRDAVDFLCRTVVGRRMDGVDPDVSRLGAAGVNEHRPPALKPAPALRTYVALSHESEPLAWPRELSLLRRAGAGKPHGSRRVANPRIRCTGGDISPRGVFAREGLGPGVPPDGRADRSPIGRRLP